MMASLFKQEIFLNSLTNDQILDRSKLKTFADDKIKLLKMTFFVFDGIENIVGKGENAGYDKFWTLPN